MGLTCVAMRALLLPLLLLVGSAKGILPSSSSFSQFPPQGSGHSEWGWHAEGAAIMDSAQGDAAEATDDALVNANAQVMSETLPMLEGMAQQMRTMISDADNVANGVCNLTPDKAFHYNGAASPIAMKLACLTGAITIVPAMRSLYSAETVLLGVEGIPHMRSFVGHLASAVTSMADFMETSSPAHTAIIIQKSDEYRILYNIFRQKLSSHCSSALG